MYVYRVLNNIVRKVVGLAEGDTVLDSSTNHPDGKATRVMVAAVVIGRELALAIDRSAKLAAPDDQRIVQETSLFQVIDQRRGSLVGFPAPDSNALR